MIMDDLRWITRDSLSQMITDERQLIAKEACHQEDILRKVNLSKDIKRVVEVRLARTLVMELGDLDRMATLNLHITIKEDTGQDHRRYVIILALRQEAILCRT